MNSRIIRAAGTCGVVLAAVVAAACSSSSTSSSSTPSGSSAKAKPYTVYISNNFVGNDWRGPVAEGGTGSARLAPAQRAEKLPPDKHGPHAAAHIGPPAAPPARHPRASPTGAP